MAAMIRSNSRRRAPRSGPYLCVAASSAALLLLLSLFVLHSRLSSSSLESSAATSSDDSSLLLLLDDADNDAFDRSADDRIDVLDIDDSSSSDDLPEDEDAVDDTDAGGSLSSSNSYFWDHVLGVKRRAFGRRKGFVDVDDGGSDGDVKVKPELRFASDDLPVDGIVRARMASIRGIEDAFLVKTAGGGSLSLREGWAKWFEAKGRFLQKDRMFGSSMEVLNPMNHPLLLDPDVLGSTGKLSTGDRLVRKAVWKELEGTKFSSARRTLSFWNERELRWGRRTSASKGGRVHADGKRWGYYPGIEPHLPFSEFMERFLKDCGLRVFMVWNSPPWMYGVRHQRGLESLLHQHKDACVVVFSETMELDFFRDFVQDGFKVAVAMPNLDELLKDTPLLVFSSVWGEWRRTRYYPIHYSELVRLAALFKYGGIYMDSDVIVLKSLNSLDNTFGMEENLSENSTFNSAVMAFGKHSSFLHECMVELYSTYDDTSLRWNGAELLRRVLKKPRSHEYETKTLKIKEPHIFFPINSMNITRYFVAPANEVERYEQNTLLKRIFDQSIAFHFWNGVTSALVPEEGSLVERLINYNCLYCLDVL